MLKIFLEKRQSHFFFGFFFDKIFDFFKNCFGKWFFCLFTLENTRNFGESRIEKNWNFLIKKFLFFLEKLGKILELVVHIPPDLSFFFFILLWAPVKWKKLANKKDNKGGEVCFLKWHKKKYVIFECEIFEKFLCVGENFYEFVGLQNCI